jgi:DNA-binding CsgD family transcriptional regulator
MNSVPTATPEQRRYAAAVDSIYETAIMPERWPLAMQAVADVFGDVGGTLTYHRSDGRLGVVVSESLLAGQDEYNREWYRHDIRAQRMMERMYLASDTVTDRALGLEEEQDRHPFFTQFLRKYGLKHFASVHIAPDPDIYAFLSTHRAPDKPAYSREECDTIFRLGRHAEKALRLGTRLMEAETGHHGFSDLFNRLNMGVFLLDGGGQVVFANDAGQRFVGDAFQLDHHRLLAREPGSRPDFEASLAAAFRPGLDEAAVARPLILQRTASGAAPVAVYMLPLRKQLSPALEHMLVRSQVIVLIIEIKRGEPADPAMVRDLLGLTLGEAKVAALVATGLTPRDVAVRLAITENTARTVLKRVFDKAGVSRQSELAAVLARAVVGGAPI